MYRSILNILFTVSMLSISAQAAAEFLRFEGSISSFYSEFDSGYDASLDFVPSQSVYFDFQIDTNLDVVGRPDSEFQDNFTVTYLGGSISGSTVTYGVTSSFPEGTTTWLFITDSLRVGTSWDGLFPYPDDDSIDTWNVSNPIRLMNNSYFDDNIIGNLSLTYRDSVAPPAIVPIPASLWLFVSGLSLFSFIRRKHTP